MCCQSTSLSFCCISTSYEFSLGEQLSCSHTSFFWKPAVIPNVFITSFFDPYLCFSSIVLKVEERVSNENLHKSPLSHLSSFEIKYYWSQNFKSEDLREISTEKLTSHNFKIIFAGDTESVRAVRHPEAGQEGGPGRLLPVRVWEAAGQESPAPGPSTEVRVWATTDR